MANFLKALGRAARSWFSFECIYLLVVPIGTVAFMIVLGVVGYIPYSDRPGPGWEGWFAGASWDEIQFLTSFGLLLLLPSALLGTILFGITHALSWIRAPRWVSAVLIAPLCTYVSGYLVLSVGWFIAIGSVAVYASMILGLVFGIWLAPRRPRSRETGQSVAPKI